MWTPTASEAFPWLHHILQAQTLTATNLPSSIPTDLPFTGGWLGWLGYDLAWEIEHLPHLNPDPLPFPIAYWYEPDQFAVLDHQEQVLWLATTDVTDLDQLQVQLEQTDLAPASVQLEQTNTTPIHPNFQLSQKGYEAIVQQGPSSYSGRRYLPS